jgi:UDP-glucose 4-epimerase
LRYRPFEAHLLASEALITKPQRSMVMNCGYGRGFSVLEVLDAVDRLTNSKIERSMEPRRPGDPASLVADNSRILATLPRSPRYASLERIVADALAWEAKLPRGMNSGSTGIA